MKKSPLKRRSSIGYYRNKCDTLIQEYIRKTYPKCMLCSNPCQVGHHFIPKSVSSRLRYELSNLVPLCNGCHMRLHNSGDPSYEIRIITARGQEWYANLCKLRNVPQKINIGYYKEMYEELLALTK